ncbi:5-dehydro-2-deoxygluconokinase [Aureibacillus halotolerans]|uniref:5-dehydro-2-deoxygluconokinase n=1 Tax=Aureibacillus halotolerans TaxID=1508390 RepID=A0A4V6PWI8_9BACI|nr:5-dehydro-2-deoxygluconokinase [Aureibacillus halotolerans]TDQ41027.1 5-dehydro-2-deoxygluconokinase [Aureibacillus halotolerans]
MIQFETRERDVIGLGRLCIDLNANEIHRPMEETRTFTKYVGGSPANIAIGAQRLGLSAGFIGKVSDDQMGRYIVNYLEEQGIDTSNVVTDKTGAVTGLAFTEILSPEDCSILMYRDNVADLLLAPSEVSEAYVASAKCLLLSGTALASSPSREAVFVALTYANKHNTKVVFDLDYRPYTWKSMEETAVYYRLAAEKCDVIVGTREEFDVMETFSEVKGDDQQTAREWLSHQAELVVIKHGQDGSKAYEKDGTTYRSGVYPSNVLKTFGAGDAYASAFIYGLLQGWNAEQAMSFGSASASIVISRHSCSEAMPTVADIEELMQTTTAK